MDNSELINSLAYWQYMLSLVVKLSGQTIIFVNRKTVTVCYLSFCSPHDCFCLNCVLEVIAHFRCTSTICLINIRMLYTYETATAKLLTCDCFDGFFITFIPLDPNEVFFSEHLLCHCHTTAACRLHAAVVRQRYYMFAVKLAMHGTKSKSSINCFVSCYTVLEL
jgi:hypothetical protein